MVEPYFHCWGAQTPTLQKGASKQNSPPRDLRRKYKRISTGREQNIVASIFSQIIMVKAFVFLESVSPFGAVASCSRVSPRSTVSPLKRISSWYLVAGGWIAEAIFFASFFYISLTRFPFFPPNRCAASRRVRQPAKRVCEHRSLWVLPNGTFSFCQRNLWRALPPFWSRCLCLRGASHRAQCFYLPVSFISVRFCSALQ